MPPNQFIENVSEMSCVLATGNVPEILSYILKFCPIATIPGNVRKMSKFLGVGNLHTRDFSRK